MSKEDWRVNNLATLFNLPEVDSVLDVACGLSLKSKFIPARIRVGVDLHEPYLQAIEAEVPYVVIKHDVRDLESIFLPKSFDLVIACDIVEHLTKPDALSMIAQCERIARKAVIIETPEGFIPQNLDILGFGAHDLQTHRSAWEVTELKGLGYSVFTRPYEMTDKKRHTDLEVSPHINLIEAIKWTSLLQAQKESLGQDSLQF